jgi:hypothetical protein
MVPADFALVVAKFGLKHFSAGELLVKGASNGNPEHSAFGLNTDPPKALWDNIGPTIMLLDRLREKIGAPIHCTSIYRSPPYNAAIGGAKNSQHMKFNAIDFVVLKSGTGPEDWAAVLRQWRDAGEFKGGLHAYVQDGFVHVDTRGKNADWE